MKDPYIAKITFYKSGNEEKSDVEGRLNDILDLASDERGIVLIPQKTRALCQNEIHELITTDEMEAVPNKTVNRVDYIGLFEVTRGGVVAIGDSVFINDQNIGTIVGFDETHFPNHYNILLSSPVRVSGHEAGFQLGDKVRIGSPLGKDSAIANPLVKG